MTLTKEQKDLYNLYYVATKAYSKALYSKVGAKALEYIYSRKIPASTSRVYQLGYAPGHDYLKRAIAPYHFSHYIMRKSGLFTDNKRYGGLQDRFYQRLMFPITDKRGYTVSFSGRRLKKNSKSVKYLVTPNTSIFKKRDAVFGLPVALSTIKKKRAVIIVEGNFDTLSMYQAGIHNVIATLGCNFMLPQLKLIKPYVDNIFLCYDGDKPGQDGIYNNIKKLFWTHLKIWALKWPLDDDPASCYSMYGKHWIRNYFASNYKPAVQYLMYYRLHKLEQLKDAVTRQILFIDYSVKIILKYVHSSSVRNKWYKYLAKKENVNIKDIQGTARRTFKNHLY